MTVQHSDEATGSRAAPVGEAVHVRKLSHVLADRLRSRILNGQLAVGAKLPPEGELVAMFKVSRPTLREAIRILEQERLIEVGRGMRAGAVVLAPTMERAAGFAAMVLASTGTTLEEVHAVRCILEPTVVRSLAARGKAAQVKPLRESVAQQRAALDAGELERVSVLVNEFLGMLADGSGNPVFKALISMLQHLSKPTVDLLAQRGPAAAEERRQLMAMAVDAREKLVELLVARDADGAESYWAGYLDKVAAILRRKGIAASVVAHDAGG